MARIPAILRLSPKLALAGNAAFFAKAVARAAAKPPPPPPTPPLYSSPQVTPPVQWNGGNTTFHPVQATNSTPFPGYGVYSPAYLESLSLLPDLNQDDPYLLPDLVPENYALEGGEDPFQNVHTVEPVDNIETDEDAAAEAAEEIVDDVASGKSLELIAEEQGLSRQELIEQLEAAGLEVETTEPEDETGRTTAITDPETNDTLAEYEEVELAGGGTVETFTDEDGDTVRVVVDDEGNRTTLEEGQETTREGIDDIAEDVSEGKGIDQIAEERGLTREQVIAQLAAAGYEVELETDELANGGEQYTTKIVDAEDGEEVIASYSSGRGAETSSVFIDAEGNETRRTEYRNGTVIETVIDADGRETKTTTVAENNGEAIEHEVQDGDYLIAIAERYGVTLEELRESNPELFDSPRDPNIIHEGETVIIEGATQTTVEVTHNGYTVTTPPDGDITVRREEDGAEVEVERGTPLEAMVETLMAVDLESSDANEARAAEAVLAAVERALAGETFQELYGSDGTDGTVGDQQKALDDAIDEYGPGQQPDRNVTYENPYGDPPLGPPPSGGDWVPMYGLWMDPEVAKAAAALNALEAEQIKVLSEFERSQKQLNVFALDPAYEEALQRAGNMFDEALAPQGLVWVPPKAEGGGGGRPRTVGRSGDPAGSCR